MQMIITSYCYRQLLGVRPPGRTVTRLSQISWSDVIVSGIVLVFYLLLLMQMIIVITNCWESDHLASGQGTLNLGFRKYLVTWSDIISTNLIGKWVEKYHKCFWSGQMTSIRVTLVAMCWAKKNKTIKDGDIRAEWKTSN